MLDAQKIENMSGDDKLRHFEAFASLAFPGLTIGDMAGRLGITRRTIHAWKEKPTSIPPVALLLLQEWALRGNKDAMALRTFAEISDSLQGVAEKMQRLSEIWISKD